MLHLIWVGFLIWVALTLFSLAFTLVIGGVGGLIAALEWAFNKGDKKMKTLLQIACWVNIVILVLGAIGMTTMTDVTPWAWVIVILGTLQSTLTLVYIHQHNKQDKTLARQTEHEALRAEILAELQAQNV